MFHVEQFERAAGDLDFVWCWNLFYVEQLLRGAPRGTFLVKARQDGSLCQAKFLASQ
jgi:hypothetical protein